LEQEDEEGGILVDGSNFNETPLYETRVTASGRCYWLADPKKKVISLEDDCGLLLFDPIFFEQLPECCRRWMDNGDPVANAEWKKRNLLPFRRRRYPWWV
jgi:hypothetical protein